MLMNTQLLKELIENLKSHHENVHANASEMTHGDCKKVLKDEEHITRHCGCVYVKSTSSHNHLIGVRYIEC